MKTGFILSGCDSWEAGILLAMTYFLLLLIGLFAGVAAGMFGIGGGIIIVPALIYVVKLKGVEAIGTSLAALIPPVGLLGALEFYRTGYINLKYAGLIAAGMFVGAYFGARIMTPLPELLVRRIWATLLLLIAGHMLITGK